MAASKKLTLTRELLSDIELAFGVDSFEFPSFIDLEMNEVVSFWDDEDFGPDRDSLTEYEENTERFIPIPGGIHLTSWEHVEDFIDMQDDREIRERLIRASGRRPHYRNFKDEVYYVGLDDEWHEYIHRIERKEVLNWLFAEQAITEDDIEQGMRFYEEDLAAQKRRQRAKEKMVKGATVICSGNTGHVSQITPGKTYTVLDEQKKHLNIRIKDDREKIIWIPKAHFELVSEAD